MEYVHLSRTPKNSYILDIKHYFHQISWQLSWVPLETPQTIWNNPISYRFISLLLDVIPLYKSASHNYADNAWTSDACHGHNFHRRDLKFSDVPITITIFKRNFKKYDENLITASTVPLKVESKKCCKNIMFNGEE